MDEATVAEPTLAQRRANAADALDSARERLIEAAKDLDAAGPTPAWIGCYAAIADVDSALGALVNEQVVDAMEAEARVEGKADADLRRRAIELGIPLGPDGEEDDRGDRD